MRPTSSIAAGAWKPGLKYTNLASARKFIKARPMETTSSFWDDGFTFNNRTALSQTSNERPISQDTQLRKRPKKVHLLRRATTVIGMHMDIHHGYINMTLNELKDIFKLRYEQRNEPPIDDVIFKLGINENCPQINCNILGPGNKQVGRFVIKKNVLAKLDFQQITMTMLRAKPIFKIQIGSKLGLRGWNSIKNILKYGEFQFHIDFSAHKSFDRIRLSDQGIKEFMYGVENSTSLRYLNIKENNITAVGAEMLKNYLPRTKVNQLNISHNPLGNDGIELIARLLTTYNYELLELDISACQFNQVGAMNIYTALRGNAPLKVLHMDENKLRGPTIKYFTEAMWKNTNLQKLSMAKCELNHESCSNVLEALENNVSLLAVNLSNNNITEKLSENLAQLFSSLYSNLKYINLSDNYLTDEAIAQIPTTRNLRSLILRNNSLKNEGAQHLLHLLTHNEALRRIDISKNMVSIKYLLEISKIIDKKKEKAAVAKIQGVRQEIVDLEKELSTIGQLKKEIKKTISEKVGLGLRS